MKGKRKYLHRLCYWAYRSFAPSLVALFVLFVWGLRISFCVGESMEPTLKSGSLLFILPMGGSITRTLSVNELVAVKVYEPLFVDGKYPFSEDGDDEILDVKTLESAHIVKRIKAITEIPLWGCFFYLEGDNVAVSWRGWVHESAIVGKIFPITKSFAGTTFLLFLLTIWIIMAICGENAHKKVL